MDHYFYIGQWQGFFVYGEAYGTVVQGHEVEFRLFVESFEGGAFTGRIIDWEGLGADGEVAEVKGFVADHFISFTKQYNTFYSIDENGTVQTDQNMPGVKVYYEGWYEPVSSYFAGNWEIESPNHDIVFEGGTWRMHFPHATGFKA